jgi:putative transposase
MPSRALYDRLAMTDDSRRISPPRRKARRLAGYDYTSSGIYFVTVCTHNRHSWLGSMVQGDLRLTAAGETVQEVWRSLPDRFPGLTIDADVVMPNHIHGLLGLTAETGTDAGSIVRTFKATSTRLIRVRHTPEFAWQRDFYDRILRNERELDAARAYIANNPAQWSLDRENPDRTG